MASRPKTPRRTLKRQKSGILESVFSYVSQEVHNFVASATGAPDKEELENGEDVETEYGSDEEGEEFQEHTQRLNDAATPPRKSRSKNARKNEEGTPSPPHKKSKSKPQRRSPSPDQLAFASSSSTAAKPPTKSILTRKPSKPTMPGSLIPFSPGSSAGGDDEEGDDDLPLKHVHFDGGSPQTAVDLTATIDDELEATPRRPRATSPHTPTPSPSKRRAAPETPNSAVRAAVQRFKPQSDSSMLLPQQQTSPSKSRGTPSPARAPDMADKGKAPAKPYDKSFGSSERRASPRRHDHSYTDEGSTDPELKIKKLEEEVKRLREELARHSLSTQSDRDTSNVSTTDFSFLAPAPPPPPPPPPPGTIFRVPNQSDNLDAVFTHVRAALRHKTPPKEKPINRAGPSGIACVGVPADKMAAFLMEMKTVKLKKTAERERSFASEGDVSRIQSLATHAKRVEQREAGLQRDKSFASEGDVSRFEPSFSLDRSRSAVDPNIGEKRKRLLDDHDRVAGELDRALKRRTLLTTSTRSTASYRPGDNSASNSFDSSMSSGPSQGQSQSQTGPSRTHSLVRDWRAGTAAATSGAGSSTTSSTATSATSADAPTPSLCSDQDAESHDDPPPSTPPPLAHSDPHNVSMMFRPPTPPLSRRSVDILPAEVHYEISLRAPHSETPVAIRGDVSGMVGDDNDGEEDMREETPMPAAISSSGLEKAVFEKRAPVSPLPEKSPRRPKPPALRANLGRSRGQPTPLDRTPVNSNGTQAAAKSNKSSRSTKGTPHPMKTMSGGGSLPRRVPVPIEDDDAEDDLAIRPADRTYADQTFDFDDNSANMSMSILGTRGGPRRVPMRQALPRTDPAVAAAARRLALAHSIGRSSRRSDSDRTASPPVEETGMTDATFTLDDLRTGRNAPSSKPSMNDYVETGEQADVTMSRTPRRSSPANSTPTRTMRRRRSTLDQELRRSSIASSIAISATGDASFSMLTGEELPPGMLDDDDDTVDFLKRMGEGEGGRYDFDGEEDEFGELEDEHMYVGLGTRPKSGFLAHGGAGGPAVWTNV